MLIRYSRWDGSQDLADFDADDIVDQMVDDLLFDGDPRAALRRLLQQQLDRYDLGSSLEDIRRRLDDVIRTEREGIERRLGETRQGTRRGEVPASLAQQFERLAA